MFLPLRMPGRNNIPWPRLGLTVGDPAGIGPEVLLKALSRPDLPPACYLIFSRPEVIESEAKTLGLTLSLLPFGGWENMSAPGIYVYPFEDATPLPRKGEASAEAGRISFRAFSLAIDMAKEGKIQAIVTAPVAKLSWSLAGIPYCGHTEYLEHLFPRAIMAFWSRKLRIALFTHHLPLMAALRRVTRENLIDFFSRLAESVNHLFGQPREYLVAGLNPHAGEEGLLGDEETKEIIPAVNEARKGGLNISGPYPPDMVFRHGLNNSRKIVIALYHDQALIAFKLVSFSDGVNLTLGLPFIRTSPDHGTAFDIAEQRVASERSMMAAIRLARRLALKLAS